MGVVQLRGAQEPPSWQREEVPRALRVWMQKSGHTLGPLSALMNLRSTWFSVFVQ